MVCPYTAPGRIEIALAGGSRVLAPRDIEHIGHHHETVTAPVQWRARLFSYHLVSAFHHYLADLEQQLRAEQRHIVNQRLQMVVTRLVFVEPSAVPQLLTNRLVLVRKLLQLVVITTQSLFQNRKHEYTP